MKKNNFDECTSLFWTELKGDPQLIKNIRYKGPEFVLPSVFDVTTFASATIASANLAAAEFHSARSNFILSEIEVDSREACAAFKSDSLLKPIGWELPAVWDAFAGDYQAKDYWIRLHTNYSYHRDAVFSVLGIASDKNELAEKVKLWEAEKLESAIALAGGCSAVMYSEEEWRSHPHGSQTLEEKPISLIEKRSAQANFESITATDLPLKGIRILDMTRVLAGPVCTKFLSAMGAEVLRIDPPSFIEVPALVPDISVGKKCTFLDLKTEQGKKTFRKLLAEAHVFVHGLRADGLEELGFDLRAIAQINSSLIMVSLNAYGWTGPWKNRRGFDSLVQMSTGIAFAGATYKKINKPTPLPMQALDYGEGYLLAAGACRALTELYKNQKVNLVRGSLVGASNRLKKFQGSFDIPNPEISEFADSLIESDTFWGKAFRVRSPGSINGRRFDWRISAGPLGRDSASF